MSYKLITAAVASLAIVALSACGSSPDTAPAAKTTTPASSRATAVGGAVDGHAVATKVVDAIASKTAHISMVTNGAPSGQGDIELTKPVTVAMKRPFLGKNIETVRVGGIAYVKGIPDSIKPWVVLKFDPRRGQSRGTCSSNLTRGMRSR